MSPRKTAPWQQQVDDRILEFVAEHRSATPTVIASCAAVRASEGRIRERCAMLRYAGLLAVVHGETYELTRAGQRYLAGDLDAAHQPTPTVERLRGDR